MKNTIVLLVVFFALFMVGCEDKNDDAAVNDLVGVWEMKSVSLSIYSNPVQTFTLSSDVDNNETMILNENGTYSYSGKVDGENESGSGTWSSTENKLTIVEDGETMIRDYSIDGDELTCTIEEPETSENYRIVETITYTK